MMKAVPADVAPQTNTKNVVFACIALALPVISIFFPVCWSYLAIRIARKQKALGNWKRKANFTLQISVLSYHRHSCTEAEAMRHHKKLFDFLFGYTITEPLSVPTKRRDSFRGCHRITCAVIVLRLHGWTVRLLRNLTFCRTVMQFCSFARPCSIVDQKLKIEH